MKGNVAALGEIIGTYKGRGIPAWFESASGYRYEYVGICPDPVDLTKLEAGQSVLAPGLLYQYCGMATKKAVVECENQ